MHLASSSKSELDRSFLTPKTWLDWFGTVTSADLAELNITWRASTADKWFKMDNLRGQNKMADIYRHNFANDFCNENADSNFIKIYS